VGTLAEAVQPPASAPELPLLLVLPLPEPLPEVLPLLDVLPLELPDVLPPLLPPLLPLLLPEELAVPPSPKFVVVLLEQPIAYTLNGTAHAATTRKPSLNFTAILPWQHAASLLPHLALVLAEAVAYQRRKARVNAIAVLYAANQSA
jgi:hypothetical protein